MIETCFSMRTAPGFKVVMVEFLEFNVSGPTSAANWDKFVAEVIPVRGGSHIVLPVEPILRDLVWRRAPWQDFVLEPWIHNEIMRRTR